MAVYIIYLALVSADLLRVGSEVDSPPIVYLMCPSRLASELNGFLYFYKVYSKHLGYLLALFSRECPIWTFLGDPLLRLLLGLFRASCLRFHCPISLGVSALVAAFCCCL